MTEINKPTLAFVNSNCTFRVQNIGDKSRFDLKLLYNNIPKSVWYNEFNSAVGFYFKLKSDGTIGDMVPEPKDKRNNRGKFIYARLYTSGKGLILGNATEECCNQVITRIIKAIVDTQVYEYENVFVDMSQNKSSLAVGHCVYPVKFDLHKLKKFENGFYDDEHFSGMCSKSITAHVTDNKTKTKLTLRGKSKDLVIKLHDKIWEHYKDFIAEKIVLDFDEQLADILGSDNEIDIPVNTTSSRCGHTKPNGRICNNRVKVMGARCWRHAEF